MKKQDRTLFVLFHKYWPVMTIMLVGAVLSVTGLIANDRVARQTVIEHASADARSFTRVFQRGVRYNIDFSRHLAGFIAASDEVTEKDFGDYLQATDGVEKYPGLAYVGYLSRAAAKRENYPCIYAFPQDGTTAKTIGRDFSKVPQRWAAMQAARDAGHPVATEQHSYSSTLRSPVVFVFTPVYDLALPISTIEERRIALKGFVFVVLALEEMAENILGPDFKKLFDLEIYDQTDSAARTLYDGDKAAHFMFRSPEFPVAKEEKIAVGDRDWHLFFFPKLPYFERYQAPSHSLFLFVGMAISVLLSVWMHTWLGARRRRALRLEHGHRFEAIFENYPAAVYSLDLQRRFLNANAKALLEFHLSRDALANMSVETLIVPENRARAAQYFQEVMEGNSVHYDSAIINAAGKRVEFSVIMIPVTVDGAIISVLGIAQNITEKKFAEWQLESSRNMLQLVINHIPQRVFWKDTESVFMGCNDAFCGDAGLNHPDQIIGKTDLEMAWAENAEDYRQDDREVMSSGNPKINYEEPQQRDSEEGWLRTSKIPITDMNGNTVGILGLYEDITERKNFEKKLEAMAHYDGLTGVANRAFFYSHVDQAVLRSQRHDSSLLALMYLDLDKFKGINDAFGHAVGDALLKAFAARLQGATRAMDVIGRLGGDEFALLLEDLADRQAAESVARKIVDAMQAAFEIDSHVLNVSTSIGIAFLEPGIATSQLIAKADAAMYKAKQSGRNRFEIATAV